MVEDQSEGSLSNTPTNSRLDDQFSVCEDYALKVRKPYTITKQREKWTQDEHRKFLEALKLYGRSWPQIEERVGSKTAVQIRSHAQKFFSKVVRESSGSDGTEAGSIEIPPPRAKRKPTRPYPRKVSPPLKKRAGPVGSTCHDSSGSNHVNTSPSSPECVSTKSLKLFGKTVFVTGSARPSSVDTVTTLRWNSMSSLVPESPTTCGLSGYGDLAYVRSSERIEPTTQCCSEDSKNGEFGKSGVLTGEEREELSVRLCL